MQAETQCKYIYYLNWKKIPGESSAPSGSTGSTASWSVPPLHVVSQVFLEADFGLFWENRTIRLPCGKIVLFFCHCSGYTHPHMLESWEMAWFRQLRNYWRMSLEVKTIIRKSQGKKKVKISEHISSNMPWKTTLDLSFSWAIVIPLY